MSDETSEEGMSREVALRIGLAARELPEIEVHQLLALLSRLHGAPLTDAKLAATTPQQLRDTAQRLHYDALHNAAAARLERACELLRSDAAAAESADCALPEPVAAAAGVASIRVACASNTAAQLDGHFGSCARFLVYQVMPGEARLVDVRSAAQAGVGVARTEKSAARAAVVDDCQILYCCSIGPGAAAKVVRAGLMPVKRGDGGDAGVLMAELAEVLAQRPPPWLAKLLRASSVSNGAATV
ncbi:hypothetical protein CKO15_07490 [Halorhodospira abdelmalekii]|uniref:NifB/NifX family molybdenum-iron cluster-binding protein n=1 Tax=Halorhodospira abdelmalekii TaxID=421629 RepID=UPI00190442A0|nr:NifB/NifX family molybdenum-iron cluster-binding protein [Halorhodospira abdelmalekii]MBK1735131.1 hypothetical protein [Halorhodospira abdelmalekii]